MGLFSENGKNLSLEDRIQMLEDTNKELVSLVKIALDRYAPLADKFSIADMVKYTGINRLYLQTFINKGLLKSGAIGRKEHHWCTRAEIDRFLVEDYPRYSFGKSPEGDTLLLVERIKRRKAAKVNRQEAA